MKKIFTLALLAVFALVSCTPNSKDPVVPYPEACDKHDVHLITTEVSGIYYHDLYSEVENSYDYGVVLCNHANVYDIYTGGVDLKPEQSYLFLDIYSDVAAPNYSASFKLPNGTYTLDPENTTEVGTVGAEYSELIVINANNEAEEVFFKSGTVTVTDHLIDAVLISEDDKVYHVQGVNKTVDNSNSYGSQQLDGRVTTTLTGDHAITFSEGNSEVYADNYEDYLIVGKNMWVVTVMDYNSLHEIMLMILADPSKELPVGTFPVSGDISKEVALFGYIDPWYGMTAGSWLVQYTADYDMAAIAAFKSGKIVITEESVAIEAVDEAGNKITGTCNAPLTTSTGWSLKKLSNASKFAHVQKNLAPRKVKPAMVVKR